jgi:tetratricopeptide (TPR) repeat protein
MPSLRGCFLASILAVALSSGAAFAQKESGKETGNAAAARDKFEAGKKAYRLGDFDEAILQWKAGYTIKDDPVFLYNIAQAYREKGDFNKAIFYYESYLKEAPSSSIRGQIEQKLAELRKVVKEQQATQTKPPTGPLEDDKKPPPDTGKNPNPTTTTPETTPEPHPDTGSPAKPGRGLKIAGIATGGTGAVLVITGIVFALQASSAQSEVQDAVARGAQWDSNLQSTHESGQRAATISAVTMSLGVAALVGGGVLYYLGVKKDKQATTTEETALHIIPSLTPNAAAVFVQARW